MVLQRSASVRTTLSMVMKKTSKFQYFLSLFNVAILLASLILLFFGLALKFSYYIDYFDFIDTNFKVVPNMLIILGSIMFVVSAISFIGFGTDTKWPYIIICIIMTILSLALLGNQSVELRPITLFVIFALDMILFKQSVIFSFSYNIFSYRFICFLNF